MSVRAGTQLDGRYLLAERIAVGGMGEVWRATDEVLGRAVAVKVLRAELEEDDAFRKRFRAEARTAGGLPHNGIAAIFDYGETTVAPDGTSPAVGPVQGDGIAYLVMELVPGESLSSILLRERSLSPQQALTLIAQAARALHAAHTRGVIHRDVKPANLMVTPEGRVKVTDFGIARPVDHEPLTMTGQVMGTAHYLAPELARGLDASPLSDVYALGVVAYECLAGRRPFDGDNQVLVATAHLSQEPPPLPPTIPPDVVAVVTAAMAKDPAQRIASAQDFAIAAEKVAAGLPWTPPATGPVSAPYAAGAATTAVVDSAWAAQQGTAGTVQLPPQPPPSYPGTLASPGATNGMPAYTDPEPAASRRWIWLVIGVVLAAVLLGWLLSRLGSSSSSPTKPASSVSTTARSKATGATSGGTTSRSAKPTASVVAPSSAATNTTSQRPSSVNTSSVVPTSSATGPSTVPSSPIPTSPSTSDGGSSITISVSVPSSSLPVVGGRA